MPSKIHKLKNMSGYCYRDFPFLYDLLHRRFLKTAPLFVKLVGLNTPPRGTILDLAAGTGAVSLPLLKKGYRVSSLDKYPGMLEQLRIKAARKNIKNCRLLNRDIGALNFDAGFDTICIRQAINYLLGTKPLINTLKKIRRALKNGGSFVFNAPNYRGEKLYPAAANRYREGNLDAFVLETNRLAGRILCHRQDALIWDAGIKDPVYIKDTNSFYLFTRTDFAAALARAGFSAVKFYSSRLASWHPSDKSLYCVAKK